MGKTVSLYDSGNVSTLQGTFWRLEVELFNAFSFSKAIITSTVHYCYHSIGVISVSVRDRNAALKQKKTGPLK